MRTTSWSGTVKRRGDLAPRPRTRLDRGVLSEEEVARARRERFAPRWTQWDYLHLEHLRRALVDAFATMNEADGPVLDLFCGTRPYAEMIPWEPAWGLDLDRHFGRADIVGNVPLPVRDASVGVVVVTQALHMVDDPRRTVDEMRRVLRPGGFAVVTIPHLFLGEGEFERRWWTADLRELFADWGAVRIRGIAGPGAALAFVLGRIARAGARRWWMARAVYRPAVLVLNALGAAIDLVLPGVLRRRWPQSLILTARRPPGSVRAGG